MQFTIQALQDILPILQGLLKTENKINFTVLNPDSIDGRTGSTVMINKITYIYRSLKSWTDLAEVLHCKLLIPKEVEYPFIQLTYKKLANDSFHHDKKNTEKYGINSNFSHIHKMEEPAFLYYYNQALVNVKVKNRKAILNLGVNRGDEFQVIQNMLSNEEYKNLNLTGIDHSESAIAFAKKTFSHTHTTFYTHDINHIDTLDLGIFDLLISIGTLQSPSIDFKPFFMKLVQSYLKKDSAIILGFPNSRWIGGEMIYGAKAPNYVMSEMSLLFNDVMFCKKYLQQKKYRVTLTGKHYIFLTATKIV